MYIVCIAHINERSIDIVRPRLRAIRQSHTSCLICIMYMGLMIVIYSLIYRKKELFICKMKLWMHETGKLEDIFVDG